MADETKAMVTEEQTEQQTQQAEQVQTEAKQPKEEPKKEAKYTDEDIDRILGKKFAEWQKKKDKEIDEAKRLAEMNATEKAEFQRDQLQKELDELKQKDTLSRMLAETRRELADVGINAPDELLTAIVSVDAEQTKEATKAFAELFNMAVSEAVTQKLSGTQHKAGQPPKGLTKEDILAITDQRERQKKISENLNLFR